MRFPRQWIPLLAKLAHKQWMLDSAIPKGKPVAGKCTALRSPVYADRPERARTSLGAVPSRTGPPLHPGSSQVELAETDCISSPWTDALSIHFPMMLRMERRNIATFPALSDGVGSVEATLARVGVTERLPGIV